MAQFPVVKGTRARFTKINSCGLPQAGAANRLVTTGFVSVGLTPVMKDADQLEQSNAEGLVAVTDRTPPVRKYFNVAVDLVNVDTELISLLTSWAQVLDYNDSSIGFKDSATVESDFGVAIEVWTGGRAADDCPSQSTDDIFSVGGAGKHYGYFLLGATEFQMGDFTIEAQIATFKFTGITIAIPQWGRGPYNVAGIDSSTTPGRLLVPVGQDEHFTAFRTPIAPPAETNGAAPLAITSLFVDPDFYFGGPSNAPAADVAPEQGSSQTTVFTLTGTPTGGTMGLKVNGKEAAIPFNATNTSAKALLVALDDGYDASDFTVTGGALPGAGLTIHTTFDADFELGTNALTGGTTPTGHLA